MSMTYAGEDLMQRSHQEHLCLRYPPNEHFADGRALFAKFSVGALFTVLILL